MFVLSAVEKDIENSLGMVLSKPKKVAHGNPFCSVEPCELLVSGSSADQWFRELPSFVSVWISGCFGNGLGRLASLHDLLSATDRSGDGVCLFPFVFALYGNKGFDPVGHRLCESSVRMYSALNHLEST